MATKKASGKRRTRRSWGRVRETGSGRFQASYLYMGATHLAPTTFATYGMADAWLTRQRHSIEQGTWKPPKSGTQPGITVEEYAREWLRSDAVRVTTRELWGSAMRRLLWPALGDVAVADLTTSQVRTWVKEMKASGAAKRTREGAYTALSAMCRAAMEDEILDVNPCRVRGAVTKEVSPDKRALSPDEIMAVAKCLTDQDRVMLLVAATCGLRWGEQLELRRKDVVLRDDGALVLHVRRAVIVQRQDFEGIVSGERRPKRRGDEVRKVTQLLKTDGSYRKVVVPPHVADALLMHMSHYVKGGQNPLLWTAPGGQGHLPHTTAYRRWNKAQTAAGIDPPVTWHELRHTSATLALLAPGSSITDVMARHGHTDPRTAQRYQHALTGRDALLAEGVSGLFKKV